MLGLVPRLRRRQAEPVIADQQAAAADAPAHEHVFRVAWNCDDVCACGAWRFYWSDAAVVEFADMGPELAAFAQAASARVWGTRANAA